MLCVERPAAEIFRDEALFIRCQFLRGQRHRAGRHGRVHGFGCELHQRFKVGRALHMIGTGVAGCAVLVEQRLAGRRRQRRGTLRPCGWRDRGKQDGAASEPQAAETGNSLRHKVLRDNVNSVAPGRSYCIQRGLSIHVVESFHWLRSLTSRAGVLLPYFFP